MNIMAHEMLSSLSDRRHLHYEKIHLSVIWIWSGVLALAMLWGGLHLYADRQTLPEGVRIGGVNVGGMDKTDALRLVEKNWMH